MERATGWRSCRRHNAETAPDYGIGTSRLLCSGGKNTQCYIVHGGSRRPLFLLRRHLSEIAARAGFVFCCFWWEFLIFAPHTLPSQYGGILIAAGLGCMATQGGLFRLFLCGFLLGLAGMLRLQYAPVAGLLD